MYIHSLASSPYGEWYVGVADRGLFRYSENSQQWAHVYVGPSDTTAGYILISGDTYFVGYTRGVAISRDNGEHWTDASEGFIGRYNRPVAICGSYLFDINERGLWRRKISEMITSANIHSQEPVRDYSLGQNFPNPFNPSTTISFSLPMRMFVSLKIFDVMGREVSTVVSEEMQAGNYSKLWNASGYSSGVYFYKLQAGGYTETKRLVLLR